MLPVYEFVILPRPIMRLPFLAFMLLLVACQQEEPPQAVDIGSAPASADEAAAATEIPAATITTDMTTDAAVPEPATEESIRESKPLNLDITAEVLADHAATDLPEQPARLPDLFAGQNKKAGARVSGELLFEQEEKASLDTMSGAKITVKVPIDE